MNGAGEADFGRRIAAERQMMVAWGRHKYRISTEEAEDAAQHALLTAWVYRDRYQEEGTLRAWLITILRNHILSGKRRDWRMHFTDDMTVFDPGASGGQAERVDLADALRAMERLKPDQQVAVALGAEGFTAEQIAAQLGIAEGTAKSRLSRGRRALSKILGVPYRGTCDPENVAL